MSCMMKILEGENTSMIAVMLIQPSGRCYSDNGKSSFRENHVL